MVATHGHATIVARRNGEAFERREERAARLLERLVTIVEPLMIVLLGAVVALVALSLLQAIYGLDASAFR